MTNNAKQNKKEPTSVFEAERVVESCTPFLSFFERVRGVWGGRGNFLSFFVALSPHYHSTTLQNETSLKVVAIFLPYSIIFSKNLSKNAKIKHFICDDCVKIMCLLCE